VDEVVRRSKQLSRLLRHTAGERGLAMTPEGWSSVPAGCICRVDSASKAGQRVLPAARRALLGDAVHRLGWSGS
jgi:RNA:NAD 2'-phosphotransferase (TPT1/KptA family)